MGGLPDATPQGTSLSFVFMSGGADLFDLLVSLVSTMAVMAVCAKTERFIQLTPAGFAAPLLPQPTPLIATFAAIVSVQHLTTRSAPKQRDPEQKGS